MIHVLIWKFGWLYSICQVIIINPQKLPIKMSKHDDTIKLSLCICLRTDLISHSTTFRHYVITYPRGTRPRRHGDTPFRRRMCRLRMSGWRLCRLRSEGTGYRIPGVGSKTTHPSALNRHIDRKSSYLHKVFIDIHIPNKLLGFYNSLEKRFLHGLIVDIFNKSKWLAKNKRFVKSNF